MSLFKSSFLFAAGTLLSRLTGVLRESVLAGVFGAGLLLDAFLVANRIPNLLRELLAEGALGASFTKVFSSLKERDSDRARRFLFQSFIFFSAFVIVICILGMVFASELVKLMTLFMEQTEERQQFFHDTVGLTRLLFPFISFMTIGAIASGVLHHHGRFFLSSISSVALNCGYILGALVFAQILVRFGPEWVDRYFAEKTITGLAVGVLVGGLFQMLIQIVGIWSAELKGQKLISSIPWSDDVRKVCVLMLPMIVAGSAGQVNVLINTNFATSLSEGAVTWLNFSFRLLQLPIGMFAVGVGVVALPALSKIVTTQDKKQIAQKLQDALTLVLWLVTPCFAFFLMNSLPAVQFVYQHGQFLADAAKPTADALYAYSFSMIGYGLMKVLTSFYYAVERTGFAMRTSLFSIGINFLANYLLVGVYGHTGLAMTTSIVLSLNALILLAGLRQERLIWDLRRGIHDLALLVLGFALSLLAQDGILTLTQKFFVVNLSLKQSSFLTLTLNGCAVGSVFILLWRRSRGSKKPCPS